MAALLPRRTVGLRGSSSRSISRPSSTFFEYTIASPAAGGADRPSVGSSARTGRPSALLARSQVPTHPCRSSGRRSGLRGKAGSPPSSTPGHRRAVAGRPARSSPWRGRNLGIAGSGRHGGGPAREELQAADGDALPGRRGLCRRRMEPRSFGPEISRYRQVRNVGSRRAGTRLRARRSLTHGRIGPEPLANEALRLAGRLAGVSRFPVSVTTLRGTGATRRAPPHSGGATPRQHPGVELSRSGIVRSGRVRRQVRRRPHTPCANRSGRRLLLVRRCAEKTPRRLPG